MAVARKPSAHAPTPRASYLSAVDKRRFGQSAKTHMETEMQTTRGCGHGRGRGRGDSVVANSDAKSAAAAATEDSDDPVDAIVIKRIEATAAAFRSTGFVSFWTQLVCSVVSAVVLLFSLAFEKTSPAGLAGTYLTAFGVLCAFLSTFWALGFLRLGRRLSKAASEGGEGAPKRGDVQASIVRAIYINIIGMGATILGAESTIGLLVAKSLTSASQALFSSGMYNYQPVLPLDVFLVQSSINTMLAHFVGLAAALLLLKRVAQPKPMAA